MFDDLWSYLGGSSSSSPDMSWWDTLFNNSSSTLSKMPWEETASNASTDSITNYLTDASLGDYFADVASNMGDNLFSKNDYATFDKSSDSSLWNSLGNLATKDVAPVATIAGGMLSSGISDMLKNRQTNKNNRSMASGAKNYMSALQTGKDEAKSEFLQNLASQRDALGKKTGGAYSLSGGANSRKASETLRRKQNESLGEFLLNLAQQKTPDLSAYTQAAGGGSGQSNSSAFWQGLTSGLGKTAGNVGSMYAANFLKSLFA